MRLRGAAALATASAAILVLPACGPSTGGDDEVTLTVLSWRAEDAAGYKKIFSEYEKKHDNVKVNFKGILATEYLKVLPTELAKTSGGPDIVQLKPYGPIQSLIKGGNLVPIDGKVDTSAFPPETMEAAKGREDKKTYGVPFAIQPLAVLYNKKIFQEKGVKPPTTWQEMTAAADKLKKAKVIPFATTGKEPWILAVDHQIFGASRFGADDFAKDAVSGKKNFSDPDFTASLDLIGQLKPYFPDKVTSVAYPDAQKLFSSGKAAMYPGGAYEIAPFQKASPDLDIGFFAAPPAPGAKVTKPLVSSFVDGSYGMNAKGKHQKEATELLKWMATKEFGQPFSDEMKQVSAVPGVAPKEPVLAELQKAYETDKTQYMMAVHFGYGVPLGRDVTGMALQKMLNGDASAADAGKQIQKDIGSWFKPE